MSLKEFKKGLEELLKETKDYRPFFCKDNPLECEVFTIGWNPKNNQLRKNPNKRFNFWNYWIDEIGFNYKKFDEERTISTTGRILKKIDCELLEYNIKVLHTNIYNKPSKSQKLDNTDKKTEIFEFLLKKIKPKLLVIYGKGTVKALNKFDANLNINSRNMKYKKLTFPVIITEHFARGYKYEDAIKTGKVVIKKMQKLKEK